MRELFLWTFVGHLFFGFTANAQAIFSEADQMATIRTLGVLPVTDNANGIYSRPAETHLKELVDQQHQFDTYEVKSLPTNFSTKGMAESAQIRGQVFGSSNADGLLAIDVIKNPNTLSLKLSLYLAKDQNLLLEEETQLSRFDIDQVKSAISDLFRKLQNDMPYQGMILSRQGTKVTVNIGKKDGVEDNQVLTIVQILKLNRHPKFNFLVSTEKEVIGKVKVLKVDGSLSFGRIITEKESGVIQAFSKVSGLDPITYKNTNSLSDGAAAYVDPDETLNSETTYGKNPNEWLPQHKPTFGKVTGGFGLGRFTESVSASQDLDSAAFFPFFFLEAEAWLTSQWSTHIGLRQGFFSIDNPASGGSPSKLSRRLSSYDLLAGYNFRMGGLINSPKIELLGGYATYRMYSDTSTPTGITTKSYGGLKTGVVGSYPIDQWITGTVGAELYLYWFTSMSESPSVSGDSDNDITQFSLFAEQNWKTNLRFKYSVDFELYNSNFSGGAASSSSQMLTNFSAGLAYYF